MVDMVGNCRGGGCEGVEEMRLKMSREHQWSFDIAELGGERARPSAKSRESGVFLF